MRVQCSICLELLTQEDGLLTSTPCGHVFHLACVFQFETKKNCPQCRHSANSRTPRKIFLAETDGDTQLDPNDPSYESMSPSATGSVEGKSDPISSCLYDILYGGDEITMPMDAVKDELVQHSWKIDSPLVKVAAVESKDTVHLPYNDQLTDPREATTKYYVSGAGKYGWSAPDHSHVKSLMAANHLDKHYRVTGFVTKNVVTCLFINIGSLEETATWDLWRRQEDVRILKELQQNERLSPLSCPAEYPQPLMSDSMLSQPNLPPPKSGYRLPFYKPVGSNKRSLSTESDDVHSPLMPVLNHIGKRLATDNSLSRPSQLQYDDLMGRSKNDLFPLPRSQGSSQSTIKQTSTSPGISGIIIN